MKDNRVLKTWFPAAAPEAGAKVAGLGNKGNRNPINLLRCDLFLGFLREHVPGPETETLPSRKTSQLKRNS